MQDKIQFFGERITPPFLGAGRRFPSDSLRRLHDKKAVPSLIKQFSNSAPLAQMEVGNHDAIICKNNFLFAVFPI